MADVDVTSPGVWDRASDAAYEELKQRELDDEANGIITAGDASRPRTKGGRLTEQNIKLWLSIVSICLYFYLPFHLILGDRIPGSLLRANKH